MSGRRLSNRSIKGPIFPSMHNQNTESKKVLVWTPGTQSLRQLKRNLRNRVRHLIDSNNETIIAVGDRVIRAVCAEPDPEYSALHLFCAALDASDDTGESWTTCMTYLMDKFDKKETNDGAAEEEPARNQSGSLLRRLLRSIAPRPLRQSNEAIAKTDVNQYGGAADAQPENSHASNSAFGNRDGVAAAEESHS